MKRKVIVAVAPVAHMEKNIPADVVNPVIPELLASQIIDCSKAGASLVHLHVRDVTGRIVGNLDTFSKTIDMVRAESDIIIQGSTGGVSELSLDERSIAVEEPRVQMASLNMGTTNFNEGIYVNKFSDIRFWAAKMKRYDVVPELEIFDTSMIDTCFMMQNEGVLDPPLRINFSLGFKGCMQARPENLYILRSLLPKDQMWTFIHEGMTDFSMIAAALSLGACGIRVGYEDGFGYESGKVATNLELVEKAVEVVKLLGYDVATVEEAKAMLGILK